MKFEHSYSNSNSPSDAKIFYEGWDVMWEYNPKINFNITHDDKIVFLGKRNEKYCVVQYNSNLKSSYFDDFNPDGPIDVKSFEFYIKHTKFFKNITELFEYGKKIKKDLPLFGTNDKFIRYEILITIKKEYILYKNYYIQYGSKNRLDMVD